MLFSMVLVLASAEEVSRIKVIGIYLFCHAKLSLDRASTKAACTYCTNLGKVRKESKKKKSFFFPPLSEMQVMFYRNNTTFVINLVQGLFTNQIKKILQVQLNSEECSYLPETSMETDS